MPLQLACRAEFFPLRTPFAISRGAKTEAAVVSVTLENGAIRGRGECVPYARYGETLQSVISAIENVRGAIELGADRAMLQSLLPPGAARNALDCALWDFDAKRLGIRAWELAGHNRLPLATTAFTISVGTPEAMGSAAAAARDFPILKIKLAGDGDPPRIRAVHAAAPGSVLIVDANEACGEQHIEALFAVCEECGVALIEQPLPAGRDMLLECIPHPVPVCADESVHDSSTLERLRKRYDAINIKLDKTGGLTEALVLARAAQQLDMAIMVGSMVGTSLSMAPALLLAPFARWVDLDGPLLLARDRDTPLQFDGAVIAPPSPQLWG